ncbi:MAG: ImmA/IrrE family metallo-endopeptidase [bacterium]|nr:ImmA/IrrE family metallo-endopeptidase [bacterium]MDE0288625.1 ImmA/IrrE family metallo-endopeptidase [bacterium]
MIADYRTRRLQAVASANELLAEAKVDLSRQVDVFGLCEQLGLWLMFRPLDGLLGAFIREGVGGVLITTERPVTVQRYTAAHELGHWRLGHAQAHVLDSEQEVLGNTPDDESEHLAQVFAAALLMPPPLVFRILERLGVTGDISTVSAYTVARESGVSYQAAVRQLADLKLIAPDRLVKLLAVTPLEIKTKIGLGQRPVSGHADVWPVDEDWHGRRIDVRIDDEVMIHLPENRSTGYRWVFVGHETLRPRTPEPPPLLEAESSEGSNPSVWRRSRLDEIEETDRPAAAGDAVHGVLPSHELEPPVLRLSVHVGEGATVVGDRYFTNRSSVVSEQVHEPGSRLFTDASLSRLSLPDNPSESPVVGGSGRRTLAVRLERPGPVDLRLRYVSSYNDAGPAEQFTLTAHVAPRRYGISIEQLASSTEESYKLGAPSPLAEVGGPASEAETDEPLT